jgi:adenylate cyclase, class 2
MNEVEIKFIVDDRRALVRALRRAGFRLVARRAHEMNVIFDLPRRPLRRRGQLLRLRSYGGRWTLTHKGAALDRRHKTRAEAETEVADGQQTAAILRALGFVPTFRYEKFRTGWSDGKGHVVLDETPVGDFAEIEGPPRWIDRTARALGVGLTQYITQSYAAVFLDWKRHTGSAAEEMTFAAVRKGGGRKRKPRRNP